MWSAQLMRTQALRVSFPDAVSALAVLSLTAEVPYHNFNHAVDVTISSYLILTACDARAQLHPVDVFTLMVAAIGHDVAHPGLTNGAFTAESQHVRLSEPHWWRRVSCKHAISPVDRVWGDLPARNHARRQDARHCNG